MKWGHIAKASLRLSRDECDALLAESTASSRTDRSAGLRALYPDEERFFKARVLVDYRREAYVSPFENVRITFDKGLKRRALADGYIQPERTHDADA